MKTITKLTALVAALSLTLVLAGCQNPASDSKPEEETKSAQPGTTAAPVQQNTNTSMLSQPLTLEAIEAGNIVIQNPWSSLVVKKNGETITPVNGTVNVSAEDKVTFFAEGSETDLSNSSSTMSITTSNECYHRANKFINEMQGKNNIKVSSHAKGIVEFITQI